MPNISSALVAHADDLPCIFKHDGLLLGELIAELAFFASFRRFIQSLGASTQSLGAFTQHLARLVQKTQPPLLTFRQAQQRAKGHDQGHGQRVDEFCQRHEGKKVTFLSISKSVKPYQLTP